MKPRKARSLLEMQKHEARLRTEEAEFRANRLKISKGVQKLTG